MCDVESLLISHPPTCYKFWKHFDNVTPWRSLQPSAFFVFVGGLLYLFRFAHTPVSYRSFHGEPAELRSFLPILRAAVHLESRAVIQFGLLLLIATPVARVLFSVVAFAFERDRAYVLVTLVVLGILLYSLLGNVV